MASSNHYYSYRRCFYLVAGDYERSIPRTGLTGMSMLSRVVPFYTLARTVPSVDHQRLSVHAGPFHRGARAMGVRCGAEASLRIHPRFRTGPSFRKSMFHDLPILIGGLTWLVVDGHFLRLIRRNPSLIRALGRRQANNLVQFVWVLYGMNKMTSF